MTVTAKLSRWLREIAPGKWRSVWKGTDSYKYCSGVAETRRRRLRILGIGGPRFANSELHSDFLTSLALARAAEYPSVHINREAA